MTISFLIGSLVLFSAVAKSEGPVDRTLATFSQTDANTFWKNLERSRPRPVSPEFKTFVLATLPPKGEVLKLKESERSKLAATRQILRLHDRDTTYEIKVIDVPYAFVGLHARTVILISQRALNLLSVEELQASIAHEAGHEYVWSEFESARERKDFGRLQELEIFCDTVSVVTMRRAGLEPARLISGIEKLLRDVREQVGPDQSEAFYVKPSDRSKFIQKATKWSASLTAE